MLYNEELHFHRLMYSTLLSEHRENVSCDSNHVSSSVCDRFLQLRTWWTSHLSTGVCIFTLCWQVSSLPHTHTRSATNWIIARTWCGSSVAAHDKYNDLFTDLFCRTCALLRRHALLDTNVRRLEQKQVESQVQHSRTVSLY